MSDEDTSLDIHDVRWAGAGSFTVDELVGVIHGWDIKPDMDGAGLLPVDKEGLDVDGLWVNGANARAVAHLAEIGLLCREHVFTRKVVRFMARHPRTPFVVGLDVLYDADSGWYGICRMMKLPEGCRKRPSSGELADFAGWFGATNRGVALCRFFNIGLFLDTEGERPYAEAGDYRGKALGELATAHLMPFDGLPEPIRLESND